MMSGDLVQSVDADVKMIPRGSLLLSEKPFVYALKSQFRDQRCDHCLVPNASLSKCADCRYVYYCDRGCQREAWSLHKFECRCLQKVAPRIVPDCARMLARLILKLNRGGDLVKGYYTKREFRRWRDLMSHYEEIKHDKRRLEHIESLSVVLRQLIGDTLMPNDVELLQLYGRLLVNSFNILDTDQHSIGTGIYLGVSVTDHSCAPNAAVTFNGTTLNMRNLEPLRRLDFTKIFISYIDLMETREQRERDLQKTYYFTCQCTRCLDPLEDRQMLAAACPNARCPEPLDFRKAEEAVGSRCSRCQTVVSGEHVQRYAEIMELSQSRIAEMVQVAYLDVCTVILGKQRGLLHPLNVCHVRMLDLALESCIQVAKWPEAAEFGLRLVPGFRQYNGALSPLLAVLHLKLGKILLLLDRFEEAKDQLLAAGEIMPVSHGRMAMQRSELKMLMLQAERGLLRV